MRSVLICIVLVLSVHMEAYGQEQAVMLRDLEEEALRNSPEILMAQKRAESAQKRITTAAALPDPMIGFEVQNVGRLSNITVGEQEMSMAGIVVTQEIPFPGKLGVMKRAAAKNAEREQESLRETRLKVLRGLREAYYDYYLAYRSAEILMQSKDVMKNFQRIAETRYATGQASQQDALRAQIEVSMLIEKIAMEEQKKEASRAMINSLLGRDPIAPLGRPGERLRTSFDTPLDELAARVVDSSPSILAKQKMVEMNEAELSLSKREFLPDMTVSAGWFNRGDMTDIWSASVMFKVPLWFWNKTAGVKVASAGLSSARYEYESAKLMTLSRLKELYSMAKTSEQLLSLYQAGIIPQARMSLQSAASNYQVGKIDFLMLLDSQTLLYRYQLAYEQELVRLNKTIAQIAEISGEMME